MMLCLVENNVVKAVAVVIFLSCSFAKYQQTMNQFWEFLGNGTSFLVSFVKFVFGITFIVIVQTVLGKSLTGQL